METFNIPSHVEGALLFERAIVFVFQPVTLPFRYESYISKANDFWMDKCSTCSLRYITCHRVGSSSHCQMGFSTEVERIEKTVQMPIPRHFILLYLNGEGDRLRFGYEKNPDELRALRLGNIYEGGRWCYGNVHYSWRDPMSFYGAYFNSLHNSDLNSCENYGEYVASVAENFNNIERGNRIDLTSYGREFITAIPNPTQIQWSQTEEEGFQHYTYVGYYAKIS